MKNKLIATTAIFTAAVIVMTACSSKDKKDKDEDQSSNGITIELDETVAESEEVATSETTVDEEHHCGPNEIYYLERDANDLSVYGNENYNRKCVERIVILDSLEGMPEDAWDISALGDGTVMVWMTPTGNYLEDIDPITMYELTIAANGTVIANERSNAIFSGFINLTSIEFNNNLDTSNVVSMTAMFYADASLTELDLSSFDTSNVTSMNNMFYVCTHLENIIGLEIPEGASTSGMYYMTPLEED